MSNKERLDKLLIDAGLVKSRERAKALIMAGQVLVNGQVLDKAGILVDRDSILSIKGKDHPFVSRGGVKLKHALDHFAIAVHGRIVLDVGASTGGFTHCLLMARAARVYAVDVGYGQLDWLLRNDPRVVCLEKTNIRYLTPEHIPDPISLAVIDVSFISLTKVLGPVRDLLSKPAEVVALIKPQFEVGPQESGKGVVRNPVLHDRVLQEIAAHARTLGLIVVETVESPITGPKGNKEFFIYLKTSG
ncbi:MAG TPA: TlyA family RNA methyltransferase [Thermodesulfobacteriota bacterium]|nr:TlyA family RNA methyltransferase [Thermodesulfobacteriota bacterium]